MKPSLADIEWAVCTKFKLTVEQIRGPRNSKAISRPRQIAHYLARELTGASYPKIGSYFHRDHTSIISNVKRIRGLLQTSPKVAAYVAECLAALPSMTARKALEREWVERLKAGEVSWPIANPPGMA